MSRDTSSCSRLHTAAIGTYESPCGSAKPPDDEQRERWTARVQKLGLTNIVWAADGECFCITSPKQTLGSMVRRPEQHTLEEVHTNSPIHRFARRVLDDVVLPLRASADLHAITVAVL